MERTNKLVRNYWIISSELFSMIFTFLIISAITLAFILFTDVEAQKLGTNLYIIFLAFPMTPNVLLPVGAYMTSCVASIGKIDKQSDNFMMIETALITSIIMFEIIAFYSFNILTNIILGILIVSWIYFNYRYLKKQQLTENIYRKSYFPIVMGILLGLVFTIILFFIMS